MIIQAAPAFRVTAKQQSYPTKKMASYLLKALDEELAFNRRRRAFEYRNSFYIASSFRVIALKPLAYQIPFPKEDTIIEYEKFAAQLRQQLDSSGPRKS